MRVSIYLYLLVLVPIATFADGTQPIEITVHSQPFARSLNEHTQPISVLSSEEIRQRGGRSLGEIVRNEPGVTSSYFGPAASRPVIRGLGGDRIKVLENGLPSQDLSAISPDHLVASPLLTLEKIEVVRGSAALLYGTNVIGGLVNMFDQRIPEFAPDKATGALSGEFSSVNKGRTGAFFLNTPVDDRVVFHFDGTLLKSDDLNTSRGRLLSSDSEVKNVALGSSYIGNDGYLGFALSRHDSNYGLPNGEPDVSIDSQRSSIAIRGRQNKISDGLTSLSMNIGLSDYTHTEFEGDEAGTFFADREIDARLEAEHRIVDNMQGVFGLQFNNSDFKAIGDESIQPPTTGDTYSAFLYERYLATEDLSLEAGVRIDRKLIDSKRVIQDEDERFPGGRANFTTSAQSLGALWNFMPRYVLGINLARTERAPTGEELFADGPHIATAQYEIGDSTLPRERSLGTDITLRKTEGNITGELSFFYNKFSNFIALTERGDVIDELPVFFYEAVPARFIGGEGEVAITINDSFKFNIGGDYVRAKNNDTGIPLPRIPAMRARVGAEYYHPSYFKLRLEATHVFDQERTAEFESSTDGYTLVSAYLSREFLVDDYSTVEFYLRASNLLDEVAREHVSFIKDNALLPGADLAAGVVWRF